MIIYTTVFIKFYRIISEVYLALYLDNNSIITITNSACTGSTVGRYEGGLYIYSGTE